MAGAGRAAGEVAELLRSLPKALRRQLVPVTDNARRALESVTAGPLPPFHTWLAAWITGARRHAVKATDLAAAVLPDHLRLNVRVLDSVAGPVDPAHASPQVLAEGATSRS